MENTVDSKRGNKTHFRRISIEPVRLKEYRDNTISKQTISMGKHAVNAIALEYLIGSRRRVGRHGARFEKWAFSELGGFIDYKARLAGVPVAAVDRRNSTRTCT